MRVRFLSLWSMALLTAGCYCSHQATPDAGGARDGAVEDSGPTEEDSGLPYVEPRGLSCADAALPEGAVCVERGWFDLRRWHTSIVYQPGVDETFPPATPLPTYLDSYALDRQEVTCADYLAYVLRTGAPPPPPTCGYEDHETDVLSQLLPEESGWTAAGVPAPGFENRPVVCVTRTEAAAYCTERDGRLPSAAEHMKAGTSADSPPRTTRFPWGDTPPPETPLPWPELRGGWYWDYASIIPHSGTGFLAQEPGAATLGRSPRGFDDLVGNASELLLDCRGDLEAVYRGDMPLVRPMPPARTSCEDGFVVAGANWRSLYNQYEVVLSQILFVSDESHPSGFVYPTDQGTFAGPTVSRGFFGRSRAQADTPEEERGPNRRSWRVGFRCAYDL